MASYHEGQYQQPADNIHLKPMFNNDANPMDSGLSDEYYKPVASQPVSDRELLRLDVNDRRLKQRIRVLKLISRIVAAIMSAVTLAPLIMTLVKFFQTKNVYFTVDGVERTAWAADSITWYTYMYTGVAAVSFVLNSAIMIAYTRGVKQANAADKINSYWSHLIQFGRIVVWAVSAGIYRYGKEPVNSKFRDLWGWTCSTAANELQTVVTNINYNRYCNVQVMFASNIAGP
ncbi:hypothetical protein LTR08_008230 [Meristemomyces frigidus]|nr:hypothetical protein LTR08_008230 [Meristemomyces frigidus]